MEEKLQTIIFLFRHSQTDIPYSENLEIDKQRVITEEGRVQAKEVGEYLKSFTPSAIFSSPYTRTLETARIIKEVSEITSEIGESLLLQEGHFERGKSVKQFVEEKLPSFFGEQFVIVSHQAPIEAALKYFGVDDADIEAPCQMGEGYRLVFADGALVECIKVNPAKVTE